MSLLKEYVICPGGEQFQHPKAGQTKAIYVAPTRSLVQEKLRDWQSKFGSSLGLVVMEITGDSLVSKDSLMDADIILITPERLDSITRRDKQGGVGFLSQVKLVLIDEVHLLNDARGPCLEAGVVARMKLLQQRMFQQSSGDICHSKFRFVACSATFKNIEDVAKWLDIPSHAVFCFGEEFRPVPIDIIVRGYQSAKSDFLFDKKLDCHVFQIWREYSNGKPTLCFCPTRNLVSSLANKLSEIKDERGQSIFLASEDHRSMLFERSKSVRNPSLRKCIQAGVGFHHSALEASDRLVVEELFLHKILPFVSTTSTLAVGVNLPAYLVIIKGTNRYDGKGSGYVKYDTATILQMVGRAGRPQFDTKGIAVIMTENKVGNLHKLSMMC